MKRKTSYCPHCGKQISLSNLRVHMIACVAPKPVKDAKRKNGQLSIAPELRVARARHAALLKAEKQKIAIAQRIESEPWENLSKSEQRARILKEQDFKCSECDIPQEWNNMPLKFELDHRNGDRHNNSRENLRLLCPNCHSQTDTYKTKNIKGEVGQIIYSEATIISALKSSESVYKALTKLGMNPHGGNYVRIRRIIKKHNLQLPYLLL